MGALNCCNQVQKPLPVYPAPVENVGVPVLKTEYSQINQTQKSIAALQQQSQQDRQDKRDKDYPSSAYAVQVTMAQLPRLSSEAQQVLSKMSRLTDYYNKTPGTSLHPYYIHKKNVYYVGQWKKGRPNGKGRVYFTNGAYFEGQFQNGVAQCQDGLYIYPDGTYYRGNIKGSSPNGAGRLVYRNNQMVYDGNWVNHRPHGNGTQRYRDGSEYSGNFYYGFKHGQGIFRWADGTIFTGNFVNGNIEGQGVQTLANGDRYEGQFKKSRRWGDGILETRVGKYSGQYVNDKKNGQGQFEWSITKKKYRGGFSKGKIDGKGELFLQNGQVVRGKWQDGSNIRISTIRQE